MEAQPPQKLASLEYQPARAQKPLKRIAVTLGILLVAVWTTFLIYLVQDPRRSYEIPTRVKCVSNLHQIGLGLILYANEHGGMFPNTLDELVDAEGLTANVFVCPASTDNPSTGSTTQQIVADLHGNGHLSYVYLGQGTTAADVAPDMVMVYEPMSNHSGDGMNVSFADGHAEWIDAKSAHSLIAIVASGARRIDYNSATKTFAASRPTTSVWPR